MMDVCPQQLILLKLLFIVACTFVPPVLSVAYDYDLTSGTWWCTNYENNIFTFMEREVSIFDFARIYASGPISSKVCNLYLTMKDVPHSLHYEWEQPWNSTGKTISFTLYTRYSVFQSWKEVWRIQGADASTVPLSGDMSSMVRLLMSNPDNEQASFRLKIKPPYGAPIDLQPWAWALISIAIVLVVIFGLAGAIICCRRRSYFQRKSSSNNMPPSDLPETTTEQDHRLNSETNI